MHVRFMALIALVSSACDVDITVQGSCIGACINEEGSGNTDSDIVASEDLGTITVIPIITFIKPSELLELYPAHPGDAVEFTADFVGGDNGIEFEAEGLIYEIVPDLEGSFAQDYLYWCELAEIRGGGDEVPYVIPVDIASSIEGNLVRFDYPLVGSVSLIMECTFHGGELVDEQVTFQAELIEVINPTLVPSGDIEVIYTGTNTEGQADRTVYLVP